MMSLEKKEKIEIELSMPMFDFLNKCAEHYGRTLSKEIEDLLVSEVAAIVENLDEVAEILGTKYLVESGLVSFLDKRMCRPSWIPREG